MKRSYSHRKAFTLLEILIVIALVVVLAIALIVLMRPKSQYDKAHDSRRKSDLATLTRTFEEWYNDKECYPTPQDVCYPSTEAGYNPSADNKCYICGSETGSPDLKPYINTLACDPAHPRSKYLYEVDSPSCPQTYRIFADLSYTADIAVSDSDCGGNGCGPAGSCGYNFGFASPNATMAGCNPSSPTSTPAPTAGGPTSTPGGPTSTPTPTPTITPTPIYGNPCSTYGSLYVIEGAFCNICGSYQQCTNDHPGQEYYVDGGGGGNPGCTTQCVKD